MPASIEPVTVTVVPELSVRLPLLVAWTPRLMSLAFSVALSSSVT